MIHFDKTFDTDLVRLRPLRLEDANEMLKKTHDPDMWIYFTSDLSIKEELIDWIKAGIEDKNRLAFAIIDAQNNAIIGSTSIRNISSHDRRVEIGWTWLAREYHGKGYNAHVKHILLKYLFEEVGLERVELKTDVLNVAARRAMKKIGLVEEGILRSHTQMTRNRRRDTIYYSVLKSEWNAMKKKNDWD